MLSAKEIEFDQIDLVLDYWYSRTDQQLLDMGADPLKLPGRADFKAKMQENHQLSNEEKKAFATIWYIDGKASGHCNVNPFVFGKEAYMHLHLWSSANRQKGIGQELVKKSIALFFEKLKIQTLYCQPYSKNPAPNKTMKRLGFEFLKTHITTPGSINFKQEVNLWRISLEDYKSKMKK